MHVTVRVASAISKRVDDVELSARAAAEELVLLPLSGQYAGEAREQGFLLGYAGWSESQFDEALARLIALLRSTARR